MRTGFLTLVYGLILSGSALAAPFDNITTHNAAVPEQSFQLAATWFLPDWQASSSSRTETAPSGSGDIAKNCSLYGYDSNCPFPRIHDGKVNPVHNLTCYKNCRCPATVSVGEGEHCVAECDGRCVEKACDPAVDWWDETSENCTLTCASDPSVCIKSECKPQVYPGDGEICINQCWKIYSSNPDYCTEKRCKNAVTVNEGEECTERCASNDSICTAKKNRVCPEGFLPGFTEADCFTDLGYKFSTDGKSGTRICGKCEAVSCPEGFDTSVNSTTCNTSKGYVISVNGFSAGSQCGKCLVASCPPKTSELCDNQRYNCEQHGYTGGKPCYIYTPRACPTDASVDKVCNTAYYIKTVSGFSGEKTCYTCEPKPCPIGSSTSKVCSQNYQAKTNGSYSGHNSCYTCEPKPCPTGSSTSTSCASGSQAEETGSYSGDNKCYRCVKKVTCEDGGYKSAMPDSQTCSTVTYQGLTCYTGCKACSCYLTSKPALMSVYTDPEPNCSKFYCVSSCGGDTPMQANGYTYDCCPRYTTMSRPGNNVCLGKFIAYKATNSGKSCCGYVCSSTYVSTPAVCSSWSGSSGGGSWNGGWDDWTGGSL